MRKYKSINAIGAHNIPDYIPGSTRVSIRKLAGSQFVSTVFEGQAKDLALHEYRFVRDELEHSRLIELSPGYTIDEGSILVIGIGN